MLISFVDAKKDKILKNLSTFFYENFDQTAPQRSFVFRS